jgi:hypothetical protein
MRGRVLLVVAVAVLIGLGVPAASPITARAVDCPASGSVTFAELWRVWRADAKRGDGGGSGDWAAARRCFGSAPFTIRAYVGIADGIGGTSATGVRPGYWEWPGLILFGASRTNRYGSTAGTYLGIVVPDGWGDLQRRFRHSWVDATVRFNHPLARQCVGYGPKKLGRPTRKEAVAICRRQPVILSIARVVRTPATDATPALKPAHAAPSGPIGRTTPGAPWIAVLAGAGIAAGLAGWRRGRGRGATGR